MSERLGLETDSENKDSAELVSDVPSRGKEDDPVSLEEKQRTEVDMHLNQLEENTDKSWADRLLAFVGVERDQEGPKKADKEEPKEEKGWWAALTSPASEAWDWFKGKYGEVQQVVEEKGWLGWFGDLFGWGEKKSKETTDDNQGETGEKDVASKHRPITENERTLDGYLYSQSMVPGAVSSLNKALKDNVSWKGFAVAAARMYGVPAAVTFAVINFESSFRAAIKNPNSAAKGLGQFMPGTWDGIQKYLPDHLKGRDRTDAEASIFATAAYCMENAKILGIDLKAPDAATKLYEGHHEGAAGYRRLQAFRETGKRFKVPKTYYKPETEEGKGKYFDYFNVWVKGPDDCENYSTLIARMAGRIQLVSDEYAKVLDEDSLSKPS